MQIPFLILAAAIIVFLMFFFWLIPVGLWISALAAGVKVSISSLIGMRLRRVPPNKIIFPLIKAGLTPQSKHKSSIEICQA